MKLATTSQFIFPASLIKFVRSPYADVRRYHSAVGCTFLVVGESEASERTAVTPPVAPRRRRGDLQLLPPGLVLPAEPAADHIRNALQLLNLAWSRVEELNLIGCPELADLLEGAEARLFRALIELEHQGQPQ